MPPIRPDRYSKNSIKLMMQWRDIGTNQAEAAIASAQAQAYACGYGDAMQTMQHGAAPSDNLMRYSIDTLNSDDDTVYVDIPGKCTVQIDYGRDKTEGIEIYVHTLHVSDAPLATLSIPMEDMLHPDLMWKSDEDGDYDI